MAHESSSGPVAARPWDEPVGDAVRPGLAGQLYYLVGGALGSRHHEWVRRDLVGPGWRTRQVIRLSVPFAIWAIVFGLLPGSASLRISLALVFLLAGPIMGLATSTRFRNRRLMMHGFTVVPDAVNPEDAYLDELEANRINPDGADEQPQ